MILETIVALALAPVPALALALEAKKIRAALPAAAIAAMLPHPQMEVALMAVTPTLTAATAEAMEEVMAVIIAATQLLIPLAMPQELLAMSSPADCKEQCISLIPLTNSLPSAQPSTSKVVLLVPAEISTPTVTLLLPWVSFVFRSLLSLVLR
jgi:hypothetical protein